jgi:hypothetical protein
MDRTDETINMLRIIFADQLKLDIHLSGHRLKADEQAQNLKLL